LMFKTVFGFVLWLFLNTVDAPNIRVESGAPHKKNLKCPPQIR